MNTTTTPTKPPAPHHRWRPVDPITPERLDRLGRVAAVWAGASEALDLAGATTAALTARHHPLLVLVAGHAGVGPAADGAPWATPVPSTGVRPALVRALIGHRPDTVIARSPHDTTAPVRSRRVACALVAALRELPHPVRLLFAGGGPGPLRPALVVRTDAGGEERFVDATVDDYDPARLVRRHRSDVASWDVQPRDRDGTGGEEARWSTPPRSS